MVLGSLYVIQDHGRRVWSTATRVSCNTGVRPSQHRGDAVSLSFRRPDKFAMIYASKQVLVSRALGEQV